MNGKSPSMSTRTLALAALLVLLVPALPAWAQVATPNLIPLGGAVTGNAATLPFAPQSFIGGVVGQGDADTVDRDLNTELASGDVETEQVHLRLVGETFAFGAEAVSNRLTLDPAAGSTFRFHTDQDEVRAGVAARLGESLSIGLGTARMEARGEGHLEFFEPAVPGQVIVDQTETVDSTLSHAGVVLRFGSMFFLGAAVGRESIQVDQRQTIDVPALPSTSSAAQTFEAERDVQRAGAAVMWVGTGGDAVRLELAAEQRDGYEQPDLTTPGVTKVVDERERTRAELELRWGSWMLAAIAGSEEVSVDGVVGSETDSGAFALGWVPQAGLAVTVALLTEENRFATPLKGETKIETAAVGLHWMF